MRGIYFGSQITHLEQSTKSNHLLNPTLVSLLNYYQLHLIFIFTIILNNETERFRNLLD
jgi:hypothetical protein